MTGHVLGVREWPNPGSVRDQIAAHVEAVELLCGELNAIIRDETKARDTKPKTPTTTDPET